MVRGRAQIMCHSANGCRSSFRQSGRAGEIRTLDRLDPNEALWQAEPTADFSHSEEHPYGVGRGTLLVFLVSGLLHEFIAGLAIGRLTGHQMIFFMLSAAGVLLSPALGKLERRGSLPRFAA
jgi:hypothetical protein